MDGLLIDSEDIYTFCNNVILHQYGKPNLPWSVKAQLQGRPGPEVLTPFLPFCSQKQTDHPPSSHPPRPPKSSMPGPNSPFLATNSSRSKRSSSAATSPPPSPSPEFPSCSKRSRQPRRRPSISLWPHPRTPSTLSLNRHTSPTYSPTSHSRTAFSATTRVSPRVGANRRQISIL